MSLRAGLRAGAGQPRNGLGTGLGRAGPKTGHGLFGDPWLNSPTFFSFFVEVKVNKERKDKDALFHIAFKISKHRVWIDTA